MHSRTLALAVALVVAAEACCCCTELGGPEPPYPIVASQEAIDAFEQRLKQPHSSEGEDGFAYFSIYMTEQEATSLLVHQLESQELPSPVEQPQIHFRGGRIEVYLTVRIGEQFPLPVMVAISPGASGGEITLTLDELIAGPLPVPEAILGGLGEMINEFLGDALADSLDEVTVTDIEVNDGRLVLFLQAHP